MGLTENMSIMKGPSFPLPKIAHLNQLFESHFQKNDIGSKIAITYEDNEKNITRQMTFESLEKTANQIARKIVQYGEGGKNCDGDYIVVVCMEPSESLIATLLAIWKAGAAYLPIDVSAPVERVQHILKESAPVLIIYEPIIGNRLTNIFKDYNAVLYANIESEATTLSAAVLPASEKLKTSDSQPIAIVLYTSGSTGVSKGVRLPHRVVLNRLTWQWRQFPFSDTEKVCVLKTVLTFVDAVSEIWAPLLHNQPRQLIVLSKDVTKNPQRLVETLERYKVERLVLVPSLLQSILLYVDMMKKQSYSENKLLNNLILWVSSGEVLTRKLVEQFLTYFDGGKHTICNFYGSTEVMGDISYHVINSTQQLIFGNKIPIGNVVDNTTIYLLDNNLQPVLRGEIGELYASGCNIAAGYIASRDREKFMLNPFTSDPSMSRLFKTGDHGRIVQNILIYEGRMDSQVKVRGHRVDLTEINAAVLTLNHWIDKAAVICYEPGEPQQTIIAFVMKKRGIDVSAGELENKLLEKLPSYAIPQVIFIEKMPLLENGKVDRQKLLKEYESSSGSKGEHGKEIDYSGIPSNRIKEAKYLFETIADVLGNSLRGIISSKSNFYELGGNSLNCIYTISLLNDKGLEIGITEFIKAPTLGHILENIYSDNENMKENIPRINNGGIDRKNRRSDYSTEIVSLRHKEHVFNIIVDSFYEKADLEQWLEPKMKRENYIELLDVLWKPIVEKGLSLIIRSEESHKYVGVALNFDAYDEPEVVITSQLNTVFDFLEFFEGPIREKQLPVGKRQILHSFMLGTSSDMNAAQNIEIVKLLEDEILKLAKNHGFAGIFSTNTNALTQQLATNVFHYQTLLTYRVNKYVAPDGTKPFGRAPNDQTIMCCWKKVA